MQTIVKRIIYRTLGLFAVLYMLTLPFTYAVLPDIGGGLSLISEFIVGFVGDHIFNIQKPYISKIISDSTGMYIWVSCILCFSVVLANICTLAYPYREISPKTIYYFRVLVSFYVSIHLLKYGFDKVFKHQFYFPEPNTLYTPVGYLRKDLLYWSSIGSSYLYSVFLGLLEASVAVLLWFRRTRLLGGMGALVIMMNVVAVNFGFDISVKLHALFLGMMSMIIAWPGLLRLYTSLVLEQSMSQNSWRPSDPSRSMKVPYVIVKSFIISMIVFEGLFVYFKSWNFNDDKSQRVDLYGAYKILQIMPQSEKYNFKRLFIHRNGYLIFQNQEDIMEDYEIVHENVAQKLTLYKRGHAVCSLVYQKDRLDSTLVLQGTWHKDSIQITSKMLDLKQLPLSADDFRWTVDNYSERKKQR